MRANEYQKLAMRTCSIPYDQREDMLRHAVFGLASEAGEVAGILQKEYQGHKFDKEHMKKERTKKMLHYLELGRTQNQKE